MSELGHEAVPVPSPGRPGTGLRRDSIVRLLATVAAAGFGLGSGIVVARNIGPVGKGTVSMLDFTASLAGATASLGLAEASITMVRRHGVDARTAVWTSLVAIAPASVLGAIGFVIASQLAYGDRWSQQRGTVMAATVIVPLSAIGRVLAGAVDAQQRVAWSSLARGVEAAVTFVMTVLAIAVVGTNAVGALVAIAIGWAVSIALLVGCLIAWGPLRRPRRPSLGFIRDAMRYAAPIQATVILIAVAGRIDLLPVQAIAGPASAGHYSVALTIAQVSMFPALALSVAAYPRQSSAHSQDWLDLSEHVTRKAVAAATITSVIAIASAPAVIPALFGDRFSRATGPAMILCGAAVLSAAQIVLGRSRAAAGHPSDLLVSFSTSVIVMLVGDYLLIRRFGIEGAAIASLVSSATGLAVILAAYRRAFGPAFHPTQVLPRLADFTELAAVVHRRS